MAVRAMSRGTGGAARANPRPTQPREGHRRPAADGRAPLGPAPSAMDGLSRLQLGGQPGTTRMARINREDRGTGDTTARAAASPTTRQGLSGSPAATRTRHGRAGNVPSDGGRLAREPPPHPTERDIGASPRTAGHRWGPPLVQGRVSAEPPHRGRWGPRHNVHGPAKLGGRWPGGAATCAAALPCRRPRSGRPTGSHPDAPWPCAPCPELLSAPRARPTPMYPNISPPPTIPAKHPAQSNAGGTKGL
ncbi:hypothetical protein IHE45_11G038500 [Dioscorea alata]|uniref:Uncharacterized protein n=1 Tax=Dioscorea alata TaxID=55571 RepID=A0ACB7V5K9_DIOAL|nr:hypothetical protein IHE45_11G038500 [Dioscorea alata]